MSSENPRFELVGDKFYYTVVGRWQFPLDMLRRDGSKAATPEDQALIDRYSCEHLDSVEPIIDPRQQVSITLVIDNADRLGPHPVTERWKSMGWAVPGDTVAEWVENERTKERKHRSVFDALLKKLSPEEVEALNFLRPEPRG